MSPQIIVQVCLIVVSYVRFLWQIHQIISYLVINISKLIFYCWLLKAHEENCAPLILFNVQYETFHDS